MEIRLNPRAKVEWIAIGDYGTECLVIDDYLENAAELRELALGLEYDVPRAGDYYPGLKSSAAVAGAMTCGREIAERFLKRLYPVDRPPVLMSSEALVRSSFAVAAVDLSRLPKNFSEQHVDNMDWIATVLHLSAISDGRGTAFWEHRPTGIQTWLSADAVQLRRVETLLKMRMREQLNAALDRVPAFSLSDIDKALRTWKESKRRPFSADEDDDWRLLHQVPARFNRLVAYPTWQLHSAVDTLAVAELSTETMRLTMNQWVGYPVPRLFAPNPPTYPLDFYASPKGLRRL